MGKFCKLLLCCSVLVVVLCISASADATGFSDACKLPYQSSWNRDTALPVFGTSSVNKFASCNTIDADVYVAFVVENNELKSEYFLSVTQNARVYQSEYSSSWDTNICSIIYRESSDEDPYFYYWSGALYWSSWVLGSGIPTFESSQALFDAFDSFINSPQDVHVSSYNIPFGYVAVFDNTADLSLSTYFPTKSGNLYVPEMGFWGYTGQGFGIINGNIPTTYPLENTVKIIWSKGDPLDIWGNTYHGLSSISGATGQLYIYNPMYRNISKLTAEYDPSGLNGTISISGSGISNFRLYPLTAGFGLHDNIIGDIDTDDYVSVEIDPDTDQPIYTDPDENPVPAPSPGGSTAVPDEVSNQNFLEKILQVLRNLLSEIGGLFTFAYDAVSSLVSAATAFFSVISGLFVWLPEEVVTVVISGFVLVVTIGVLKSFL